MKQIIKESVAYVFDDKEKLKILNRLLGDYACPTEIYWDYRDSLSEKQIYKIITEEDGLNEVENEIYLNNIEYLNDEINNFLNDNLSEEELLDDGLREYLNEEIEARYNTNIDGLISNSGARMRIMIQTNEEYLFIPNYKNTEYYKFLKERFNGYFNVKDLKDEIESFIGSDYGKLVFFFNVSGNSILKLREEYLSGKITINKDINAGFINDDTGCGGTLDLKLKKPITLNLKDWTEKGESYYSVDLSLDSYKYGVQETYNLTNECWRDY